MMNQCLQSDFTSSTGKHLTSWMDLNLLKNYEVFKTRYHIDNVGIYHTDAKNIHQVLGYSLFLLFLSFFLEVATILGLLFFFSYLFC